MVFLYVYFSIKRIEFVKSKLGIALTAIATVICATCMSLGLSGISLNLNSKISLVPYLVAFISLENILVITQSVISTPAHLDVKIRIAQGVSREGWNITKNLCAEITILSFIFLLGTQTIEASVQEFCHLSLMGLLSDFFLQICFFVPILSMDMNQLELSDSVRKPQRNKKMFQKPVSGMNFWNIELIWQYYSAIIFTLFHPATDSTKINRPGHNICMYWTHFRQPTAHVQQTIFGKILVEVCSLHFCASFGTFCVQIGNYVDFQTYFKDSLCLEWLTNLRVKGTK